MMTGHSFLGKSLRRHLIVEKRFSLCNFSLHSKWAEVRFGKRPHWISAYAYLVTGRARTDRSEVQHIIIANRAV